MAGEIQHVESDDLDEYLEGWTRRTEEPHLLGVSAYREDDSEWPWTVFVSMVEFVREEPLESQLRDGMLGALSAVAGVTAVAEEDREVWIVAGSPRGVDLVAAAAAVVDALVDRVRPSFGANG